MLGTHHLEGVHGTSCQFTSSLLRCRFRLYEYPKACRAVPVADGTAAAQVMAVTSAASFASSSRAAASRDGFDSTTINDDGCT